MLIRCLTLIVRAGITSVRLAMTGMIQAMWLQRAGSRKVRGAHIEEDKADEEVEGDAEEVEDCGAQVLGHILAAQLHHGGPEHAHQDLSQAHAAALPWQKACVCMHAPYILNLGAGGHIRTSKLPGPIAA